MKLQRYYQTEEKSWMRIGVEALLPLIAGKVIDNNLYILGFAFKYFISIFYCIDHEDIIIRTNNTLLQKDNTLLQKDNTFQHNDIPTHFTKDKTSLTQMLVEGLKFSGTVFTINYSINNLKEYPGLAISLVSLSLDVINKLFISNTTEINYQYSLLSNYSNNYEFYSYIEWVGEADEDGYCECVVKDSYGNTYEDISLA